MGNAFDKFVASRIFSRIKTQRANDERDLSSLAGMSRSVYVTQLMTVHAVSLNDHRKSYAFMSFLDKLGGVERKTFPDLST